MIDQIGGWSTAGARQAYGEGYGLKVKKEWMEKMQPATTADLLISMRQNENF